jgi:hypothetical protein
MSKLYPVLIPKALGWLLMAGIIPYSRAVVAQMWPRFVTSNFILEIGLTLPDVHGSRTGKRNEASGKTP